MAGEIEAFIYAAWRTTPTYGWHIALASVICIALELITSHERTGWPSRLRGALFWMVYLAITGASLAIFVEV